MSRRRLNNQAHLRRGQRRRVPPNQLLVQAFVIPFTAGVTALLYLDQRMRREGLDVSLYRAAQARAAARQR